MEPLLRWLLIKRKLCRILAKFQILETKANLITAMLITTSTTAISINVDGADINVDHKMNRRSSAYHRWHVLLTLKSSRHKIACFCPVKSSMIGSPVLSYELPIISRIAYIKHDLTATNLIVILIVTLDRRNSLSSWLASHSNHSQSSIICLMQAYR